MSTISIILIGMLVLAVVIGLIVVFAFRSSKSSPAQSPPQPVCESPPQPHQELYSLPPPKLFQAPPSPHIPAFSRLQFGPSPFSKVLTEVPLPRGEKVLDAVGFSWTSSVLYVLASSPSLVRSYGESEDIYESDIPLAKFDYLTNKEGFITFYGVSQDHKPYKGKIDGARLVWELLPFPDEAWNVRSDEKAEQVAFSEKETLRIPLNDEEILTLFPGGLLIKGSQETENPFPLIYHGEVYAGNDYRKSYWVQDENLSLVFS